MKYIDRYDEDEDLIAPETNPHLCTNIRQLRIEKRMSTTEFAKELNVAEDIVKAWEKGEAIPSEDEIKKMVEILRISYYDMMTRDILREREETTEKMKKSKERISYNWYYGSRKKVVLDIIYLVSIPLVFLIAFLLTKNLKYELDGEIIQISTAARIVIAYCPCAIISGVIFLTNIVLRYQIKFQFWYIFIIQFIIGISIVVSFFITIPYYIYIIYNLIKKRGRNR